MFKPFALAIATGLLLTVGCEKKSPDPADLLKKVPTVAPEASKGPGTVFDHLQYAIVRQDPNHLEVFYPADDRSRAMGTTQKFHNNAGYYRLGLTAEEINTLGLQDFVAAGYISDRWTIRDLKDAMEGKTDPEPGMEKLNENKLDMPYVTASKEVIEKLNKELIEALDKSPRAIYAGGLYRLLKAIPDKAWVVTAVTIGSNAEKDKHDLVFKIEDKHYCTIAVGKNEDGTMYIDALEYETAKNHGPRWLAKNFADTKEQDTKEESK